MPYNTIFEEFYDADDDQVRGLIAYGRYKIAKREWMQRGSKGGQPSTADELAVYHETWTPANIESKRAEADQILRSYSEAIIAQERPRIVEEALRGNFWKTVWVNIASAGLYTLLLVAIVVILRWSGVDLLSIANQS